eukprot:TRINITY_DN5856_c0_g1_i1.p1 TRINITY_DN5856_c0_g1~~TRINITY_DN5856_c0_g1_i1.p1  ORF type:complete len:1776 (-),score=486.12 TRINITY_DN5856_c0_g1_i1:43-5196(-)
MSHKDSGLPSLEHKKKGLIWTRSKSTQISDIIADESIEDNEKNDERDTKNRDTVGDPKLNPKHKKSLLVRGSSPSSNSQNLPLPGSSTNVLAEYQRKKAAKRKLKERKRKEKQKIKEEKKAKKQNRKAAMAELKRDQGLTKKKRNRRVLQDGRTIKDFCLKVNGLNSFILRGNNLLDYDYVVDCIQRNVNISLRYVDISQVKHQTFQSTSFDASIAEDVGNSDENFTPETEILNWPFQDFHQEFSILISSFNKGLQLPFIVEESTSVSYYFSIGLYYGGELLEPLRLTAYATYSKMVNAWNEEINFLTKGCSLPLHTKLCITMYQRVNETQNLQQLPEFISPEDKALAWTSTYLINHSGAPKAGDHMLSLWPFPVEADPIGPTTNNNSPSAPVLNINIFYVGDPTTTKNTRRNQSRSKSTMNNIRKKEPRKLVLSRNPNNDSEQLQSPQSSATNNSNNSIANATSNSNSSSSSALRSVVSAPDISIPKNLSSSVSATKDGVVSALSDGSLNSNQAVYSQSDETILQSSLIDNRAKTSVTPTKDEEKYLRNTLLRSDALSVLGNKEKTLLWKYRYWLQQYPHSITQIICSVDWGNKQQVNHLYELLFVWPRLDPLRALELLGYRFPDNKVRSFAVSCLNIMTDNQLFRIILQLTQALKFEPNHDSALARFLIQRAVCDQNQLGHYFFWHLKSQLGDDRIGERYSLLLETYLKVCTPRHRKNLILQDIVTNSLTYIAVQIRNSDRNVNNRTDVLHHMLKTTSWPAVFHLPLDPRILCSGFIIDKCKVLGSKTTPLYLAFKNAETGLPHFVIFKVGDDLRQDVLTIQIIKLIDNLWKKEGLDLKLKPYNVLSLGDQIGMIEVVRNAATTSNINIELGGLRAVTNSKTLAKWLRRFNQKDEDYEKAVETFILSCAGYCVITYIMGFADRHNDNIMLSKEGHLFHIDFGHFLGHYRKVMGIYMDKAEFVFLEQYYGIIGKKNYPRFVQICQTAYNIIRRHAVLLINLFVLMLSSGLPEIKSKKDIEFLKNRFQLHRTEEEASKFFEQKIQESREAKTIQINHAFHVVYHGMKAGSTRKNKSKVEAGSTTTIDKYSNNNNNRQKPTSLSEEIPLSDEKRLLEYYKKLLGKENLTQSEINQIISQNTKDSATQRRHSMIIKRPEDSSESTKSRDKIKKSSSMSFTTKKKTKSLEIQTRSNPSINTSTVSTNNKTPITPRASSTAEKSNQSQRQSITTTIPSPETSIVIPIIQTDDYSQRTSTTSTTSSPSNSPEVTRKNKATKKPYITPDERRSLDSINESNSSDKKKNNTKKKRSSLTIDQNSYESIYKKYKNKLNDSQKPVTSESSERIPDSLQVLKPKKSLKSRRDRRQQQQHKRKSEGDEPDKIFTPRRKLSLSSPPISPFSSTDQQSPPLMATSSSTPSETPTVKFDTQIHSVISNDIFDAKNLVPNKKFKSSSDSSLNKSNQNQMKKSEWNTSESSLDEESQPSPQVQRKPITTIQAKSQQLIVQPPPNNNKSQRMSSSSDDILLKQHQKKPVYKVTTSTSSSSSQSIPSPASSTPIKNRSEPPTSPQQPIKLRVNVNNTPKLQTHSQPATTPNTNSKPIVLYIKSPPSSPAAVSINHKNMNNSDSSTNITSNNNNINIITTVTTPSVIATPPKGSPITVKIKQSPIKFSNNDNNNLTTTTTTPDSRKTVNLAVSHSSLQQQQKQQQQQQQFNRNKKL